MYYLHVYGIFSVVDNERSIERRGSYMKNRKAIIVIGAIGLIVALMIAAVGVIAVKGLDISTGRYLEAKNGTSMIVIDNSPIQMSSRTNKTKAEIFNKLDVGDEILIIHDGIAETYPGKYLLHGFYPYSKMRNVKRNPDEYLYCACIWGEPRNRDYYEYLASRGIEAWIGASITSAGLLGDCFKLGAKLVTTNYPGDCKEKLEKIGAR